MDDYNPMKNQARRFKYPNTLKINGKEFFDNTTINPQSTHFSGMTQFIAS